MQFPDSLGKPSPTVPSNTISRKKNLQQ